MPMSLRSEIPFLEQRILTSFELEHETCVVIEQNSTRRPHCGNVFTIYC